MLFNNTTPYNAEYIDTRLQQIYADGSISTVKLIDIVSEYHWPKNKKSIKINTLNAYFTKVKISYYRANTTNKPIYALLVNNMPIIYVGEPGSYAYCLAEAYLDGHFKTFKNSKLLNPIIDILEAESINKYISDKNKDPVESMELLQKYYQVNDPNLIQYRKRDIKIQIFVKATFGNMFGSVGYSNYVSYHNISIRGFKVKIGTLIDDAYMRDPHLWRRYNISASELYEPDYIILRNAINAAISLWQNVIPFSPWSIEKNYVKIDFSFDRNVGVIANMAESGINLSFKHDNLKILIKPIIAPIICKFTLEFIKIFKMHTDIKYAMFFRVAVHS